MNIFLIATLVALGLSSFAQAQSCSKCHSLGFPPPSAGQCNGPDCAIYNMGTQSICEEVTADATRNGIWKAGLSLNADMIMLKGKIAAYQIRWFSGGWSQWYVPGVNDIDNKVNMEGSCGMRRVWSYFFDHQHKYIVCK